MLCITQSDSARGAIDYFTKSLSVEDYYSMKQSIAGTYHGEGAVRLGLPEEVTRDTFQALVYNRSPGTRESITVRQKEERRPGYDFTFNLLGQIPRSLLRLLQRCYCRWHERLSA